MNWNNGSMEPKQMFLNGFEMAGFENSTGKELFFLSNHVDFLETHEEAEASCFQEKELDQ